MLGGKHHKEMPVPTLAQLELGVQTQGSLQCKLPVPTLAKLETGEAQLVLHSHQQLVPTCALWAARLLGALPSAPNALWGLHMLILADKGVVQIVLSAHQEPI